jgi:GNAT superfamily N-acetyltransferase
MSESSAVKIRVAALSASDSGALRTFYRTVWNSTEPTGADSDSAASTEDICPFPAGLPAPIVGVYRGERIIGHLGSIPTEFWDGSRNVAGHWVKGLMVLEEFRNGPIGYLLVKEMMQNVSLSGAMVVAAPARRLFEACGFKSLGAVPNYIAVLRPRRVLQAADVDRLGLSSIPRPLKLLLRFMKWGPIPWVAGGGAAAALALLAGANRLMTASLKIRTVLHPPAAAEVDPLWLRLRAQLNLAPSRGGSYLEWRYDREHPGRYQFIEVRRQGRLTSLVVARLPERVDDPRLAGLRVGLIVDLLVDPADTTAVTAALLAARQWGAKAGCDAILLTISHLGVGRLVKRLGFVRIPGNIHCMLRVPAGALDAPASMEHSWLMRGDAWSDDI